MGTSLAVYATLLLNAALTICCAALCMLILWQDVRRGSNQLVALTLACFSVYGATNLLFHFSYLFDFSAQLALRLVSTTYIWSIFGLFGAAARLSRMEARLRLPFNLAGLGMVAVLTVLMWTGLLVQNLQVMADHATGFDYTAIGYIGLAVSFIYQFIGIGLVRRVKNERSRYLWPVLVAVPLVAMLNLIPSLQAWPHDALSLLIIGLMVARLLMREHVFKPMHELNRKLMLANDQLAQANLVKSQFLANMSHELRTPLNSIIGYTDLITTGIYGPLSAKQEDRLKKISRNGRELLALINDVLDLSKIEAGRLTLIREPVELPKLVEAVLENLRPLAESQQLTITCTYPPKLAPVLADMQRAEQILHNIINNAIRFTTVGGITIEAQAASDEIMVSVSDTGRGIPLAEQANLFNPTPISSASNGSAQPEARQLGLTLTRHLVQLHGGRIWFSSPGVPGKGTTFYLTFPSAVNQTGLVALNGQARGTVVCIDDNLETLEVLQGMLESAGYQVHSALDDKAGLQRVRDTMPDVILLDILMPGVDGWQVLKKLRADPKISAIPVIVISNLDQRARAQQVGAAGSLVKPLRRTDLLESVQKALQRIPARPALSATAGVGLDNKTTI